MSAEEIAELLRTNHPDVEPWDVDPVLVDLWLREFGVESQDGERVAAILEAWDRLFV